MSEDIVEIFESEVVDKDELLGRNVVAKGEEEVYESQFNDDDVINEIHQFRRQQTEREINKSWNEQLVKEDSNETIERIKVENVPKVEESTKKLGSKLSKSAVIYTNDYALGTNDKRPPEKEPLENSHTMETFKELLRSDFDKQLENLERLSLEAGKENNDTTGSDDYDSSTNVTLPSRLQLNFRDLQRLSRLEAKVTEVENRVGISEVNDPISERTPLVTQINKLYRHLALLESTEADQKTQLDRFKRHLNKLDQDFERTLLDRELRHRASSDLSTSFYSSSSSSTFGNSIIDTPFVVDETMKINDLYVRYHNLQQFDQYIPHLIRRLKPMQAIHDDVIQTVNTVQSLNEQVSEMRAQFSEWSALLERVDAKLDANIEVLRTGLRSVDEKFAQLQKDRQD